jgi:glucose-1-phosphate thymidylyltransferase
MPQKGVLLFAAGPCQTTCTCGSRRLPALEHVANRPIVHHVVDGLRAAGVDELVVTGTADVLIDVRACLSTYQKLPLKLDYAICSEPAHPVAALRAAAPIVGAAPCIVHAGDGVLDEPLAPYLEALTKRSLDLVLLCQRPSPGGPSRGPLGDGIAPPTVPELLCDAGIGVFGPGAFRDACQTDSLQESSGLGELAQHLSDGGGQVQVCVADGFRRYRGDPQDLLEVNRLALDLLSPEFRPPTGSQNRIEGRVQIDRTATVTTSVIVGPVVIGEGAQVTNAYIGPYTSIGAGARIEGVEIERSIISPGASVMHVGARLVSSLVGRGANVFRDFSLPRAMRLKVAEGDEVALC